MFKSDTLWYQQKTAELNEEIRQLRAFASPVILSIDYLEDFVKILSRQIHGVLLLPPPKAVWYNNPEQKNYLCGIDPYPIEDMKYKVTDKPSKNPITIITLKP